MTNPDPTPPVPKEEEMSKVVAETKEKAAPVRRPSGKSEKTMMEKYKEDHENAGFRPMTAGWAVFQVLRVAMGKEFKLDDLTAKAQVWCKKEKIKFNPDARMPIMIRAFTNWGFIEPLEDGRYKKLIK